MTFRQAMKAVWRRWILALIVVVVAVAVAGVFLVRQSPEYTSTIDLRLSTLATSAAASGQIGNTQVDFNPESVTSATVLASAAKSTGTTAAALAGDVTFVAGSGGPATANQLSLTATGPTAAAATERATAVAKAYTQYLQAQTAKALTAAQTQAASTTASAGQYQAEVTRNPADAIANSNLQAALAQLQTLTGTIQKITNAGAPVSIVAAATPGQFVGVKPAVALAVALLAGLVAGIGIALIRDQFDNRLRDEADLEDVSDVTVLGSLSLDKNVARQRTQLPAADRKRTALTEDLRALRTTLQVLLPTTGAAVVFTSVEPGDGKTFVSANVALAWARAGRSVVLVGGDLRRPGLAEHYGDRADGRGLAELLVRASESTEALPAEDIEAALRETEHAGLRILPAGEDAPEPADLLARPALGGIIATLRSLCDVVVIDSPPALALSDAGLLAAHADGAVLIASVRRTDRGHLAEALGTLTHSGVTVLGTVANRSRRRVPKSYGAYYLQGKSDRGPAPTARSKAGALSQRSTPSERDEASRA